MQHQQMSPYNFNCKHRQQYYMNQIPNHINFETTHGQKATTINLNVKLLQVSEAFNLWFTIKHVLLLLLLLLQELELN